jgi:spore coat protein H
MKQVKCQNLSRPGQVGNLAVVLVSAMLAVLLLVSGCGDGTVSGDLHADAFSDVLTDAQPDVIVADHGRPDADGSAADTSATDISRDIDDSDIVQQPSFPVQVNVEIKASDWKWLNANPQTKKVFTVTMTVQGKAFPGTAMELHGGFARTVPKLSFHFEIADDLATALDLFGDGPEQQRRFVLKAGWIDATWLREYLTMDLIRRSGGFAPRISFAEFRVNGEWQGLYVLVERIDRPWFKRNGLEDDEVNLFKAETHSANWRDKENPADGFDQQCGDPEHVEDLAELLEACTYTPTTDEDFAEEVEPLLNLEDFTVFMRVNTFAGNEDSYTKNYFLYHDLSVSEGHRDFPFRIVGWDTDATWGNYWDGKVIAAIQTRWYGWDSFSPRLLAVPKWRAHYIAEYRAALDAEFQPETLIARVDQMAEKIRLVARKDLLRWDRGVTFEDEVARLKDAIVVRHQTMQDVLAGVH